MKNPTLKPYVVGGILDSEYKLIIKARKVIIDTDKLYIICDWSEIAKYKELIFSVDGHEVKFRRVE